jgi:hypothetical protein
VTGDHRSAPHADIIRNGTWLCSRKHKHKHKRTHKHNPMPSNPAA